LDGPVARKVFYLPLEAPLVLSCIYIDEILNGQNKEDLDDPVASKFFHLPLEAPLVYFLQNPSDQQRVEQHHYWFIASLKNNINDKHII
jgi:hypothetical protein